LKMQADIEEDSTHEIKLVANMPLGESGGIKVALRQLESDSFMYNMARNNKEKLRDLESASISIASNLGENLYANLTVDYYNDNSAHNLITITEPAGAFCAVVGLCRTNYNSEEYDYMVTWQGERFESGVSGVNYTLNLQYEGDGFTFKSITGQNDFEELMDICSWGGPHETAFYGPFSVRPASDYPTDRSDAVCAFPVVRDQEMEQLSQEFQLVSDLDGPFNYTLGLFYLEAESYMDSGPVQNFLATHELEAKAVYADVVYDLSDEWQINLGVRYTEEEKSLDTQDYLTHDFKKRRDAVSPRFTSSVSDDNMTYKLTLSRNTSFGMIYGGVSTGYRSGGWQMRGVGGYLGGPGATDTLQDYGPFQAEEVTNTEIGIRSELNEGRVILNFTAFQSDYEDKQEAVVNGPYDPCNPTCTFVVNSGEVEIDGYELEMKALIMENLMMNAAVGILDSSYEKFDYLGDDISDQWDPIYSPDLTMNIGFDYSTDMWGGELMFSGSMNFMDEVEGRYTPYVTDVQGTRTTIESFEQLDLSISYIAETATGGQLRVTVFGNDILEEGGRISRTFEAGGFAFASTLKRQHFGMKIGYEF
jgi:iron complex outermembrane receptor protein